MGDYLLCALVAGCACLMVVFGLPALRDVAFRILVFEDLSVGAMAGGWFDFWRWMLGAVNGLVAGAFYFLLMRGRTTSTLVNVVFACFAGTLGTLAAAFAVLVALLALWLFIGLFAMLFSGPF